MNPCYILGLLAVCYCCVYKHHKMPSKKALLERATPLSLGEEA